MGFKILAINPGSTSTKIALYDDEQPTLALTLRHSAEEIARFPRIIDQLDWRKEMVLEALAKNNFDVKSLSAVIGRGGLIKPIESGVYEVNAALKNDLVNAQREHASNLGGLIAEQIAQAAGVKAYIADPVVVDELDDIARLSGIPECPRISIFHALNQKAIARRHAENELFTSYARLEKAIQLYRSSNYGLEKDFALIIEGVNLNFQKRNISLLEFIDYYETYKTTCLQLYQTQKEVLLALEEVNTVTGSHVFNY